MYILSYALMSQETQLFIFKIDVYSLQKSRDIQINFNTGKNCCSKYSINRTFVHELEDDYLKMSNVLSSV